MAADDDEDGHRPDRLWRVEQRQTEIIARLDRLQNDLTANVQRREQHEWRMTDFMAAITKHLEELIKRPAASSLFGEPAIVRMVVLGFLALATFALTGKALDLRWLKLIKPPSRWGREPRCSGFAMLVGAALGTLLSWWLSTPLTPWLEFKYLTATYRLGDHEIQIAGVYRVNQECDG